MITSTRRWAGLSSLLLIAGLMLPPDAQADTQTRVSAFEYDPVSGLLTKEIIEPDDPNLCLVTTHSYDSYGNQIGSTTRNCSGAAGSHPGTNSEAAAPAAGSDAVIVARSSSTTYDARGRFPVSATNALGQSETRSWNGNFGTVASLTGPNGLTTSWTYDSFGRKLTEARADGTGTTTSYALCGSGISCPSAANGIAPKYAITTTQAGHPTGRSYYDGLDRGIITETQGKDGGLIYAQTEYDHLGRAFKTSRPSAGTAPQWTTVSFDAIGRPVTTTAPDGSVSTVAYNGLTTVATNAKGQTRTEVRNSQGQLATVTDVYGKSLNYSYDAYGNLTRTTDAQANVTTISYDKRGRKTAMNDPDQGVWSYAYDALGQLKRQTDAKGQVVTFAYDKLGRMTQRNEPDLVSTWSYDTCDPTLNPGGKCVGKPIKETADNGYVRTLLYDAYGRPTAELDNVDQGYGVTKNYDSYGRVNTLVYPTGFQTSNVYSATGYLIQVKNAATQAVYWQANTIDAEGRVVSESYGNGVINTRTYNAQTGRLTQTQSGPTANTSGVSNQIYVYDSLGNLTQRYDAVTNLNESFDYDSLNRLRGTSAQAGSGPLTQTSVTYDAIGNIITKSDVGSYSYGVLVNGVLTKPHAVTKIMMNDGVTQYAAYTYDANGNMTSGAGRTLTWTSWNMPANITGATPGKSTPDGTASSSFGFVYNVAHERVKETLPDGTVIYNISPRVDTGIHVEKRVKPDGTISYVNSLYAGSFPFGTVTTTTPPGGAMTTKTRYFHVDHLGSIVAITDEAGTVTERRSYDAWGKRRNSNGTPMSNAFFTPEERHGFTGHEELNELGLIHMNGRLYDPATGRFLSADPTIQYADDMQNYNRYSYINNNPLSTIDASGYGFFSSLFKSVKKLVKKVGKSIKHALRNPVVRTALAVAAGIYTGGLALDAYIMSGTMPSLVAANVIQGAVGGFTMGFVGSGGNLKAGLVGALAGAAYGRIQAYYTEGWTAGRVLSNATVGGVSSEVQGGRFQDGFSMGVITSSARAFYDKIVQGKAEIFERSDGTTAAKNGDIHVHQQTSENFKSSNTGISYGFNPDTKLPEVPTGLAYWVSEASPVFRFMSRFVPGVQGFSTAHDLAMAGQTNSLYIAATIPGYAVTTYTAGFSGVNSVALSTNHQKENRKKQ